jgi:hypothetical protein
LLAVELVRAFTGLNQGEPNELATFRKRGVQRKYAAAQRAVFVHRAAVFFVEVHTTSAHVFEHHHTPPLFEQHEALRFVVHINFAVSYELDERQWIRLGSGGEASQVLSRQREQWFFATVSATSATKLEELLDCHRLRPLTTGAGRAKPQRKVSG